MRFFSLFFCFFFMGIFLFFRFFFVMMVSFWDGFITEIFNLSFLLSGSNNLFLDCNCGFFNLGSDFWLISKDFDDCFFSLFNCSFLSFDEFIKLFLLAFSPGSFSNSFISNLFEFCFLFNKGLYLSFEIFNESLLESLFIFFSPVTRLLSLFSFSNEFNSFFYYCFVGFNCSNLSFCFIELNLELLLVFFVLLLISLGPVSFSNSFFPDFSSFFSFFEDHILLIKKFILGF